MYLILQRAIDRTRDEWIPVTLTQDDRAALKAQAGGHFGVVEFSEDDITEYDITPNEVELPPPSVRKRR